MTNICESTVYNTTLGIPKSKCRCWLWKEHTILLSATVTSPYWSKAQIMLSKIVNKQTYWQS